MKRREILRYAALATGAVVSLPLANSLLVSCQADATAATVGEKLAFFGKKEAGVVKDLVDLILPKTDSPSASELGVHTMIDQMVGNVYRPEAKTAYQENFAQLMKHLQNAGSGKGFRSLAGADKVKLLQGLDASKEKTLEKARTAYLDLKQQTIAYYLSSEEIATNYLTYLPVPGAYEACISLEQAGGKAWAI